MPLAAALYGALVAGTLFARLANGGLAVWCSVWGLYNIRGVM